MLLIPNDFYLIRTLSVFQSSFTSNSFGNRSCPDPDPNDFFRNRIRIRIRIHKTCEKPSLQKKRKSNTRKLKSGGFLRFFYVLYSTLLHLPPLRFHCVGGCWDRSNPGLWHWQSDALTSRPDLIHTRKLIIIKLSELWRKKNIVKTCWDEKKTKCDGLRFKVALVGRRITVRNEAIGLAYNWIKTNEK